MKNILTIFINWFRSDSGKNEISVYFVDLTLFVAKLVADVTVKVESSSWNARAPSEVGTFGSSRAYGLLSVSSVSCFVASTIII